MKSLVLIALFSVLASCATTEPVVYTLPEREPYSERVQIELGANCVNGLCEVSAVNLQRLLDIITRFNDKDEKRVDAYNSLNLGLSHCEYSNSKLRQAIELDGQIRARESIISGAKQLITAGICGVLLLGN